MASLRNIGNGLMQVSRHQRRVVVPAGTLQSAVVASWGALSSQITPKFAAFFSTDTTTTTTSTTITTPPAVKCSVGIFLDLDNVGIADTTINRSAVAFFMKPLKEFANGIGRLDIMHGFANTATQTWHGTKSSDDLDDDEFDQEWLQPTFDDDDHLFPGAMVQTGYDEQGVLRCGVCGAKMKLTKKDRARGWTEFNKLDKHMRTLPRPRAKQTYQSHEIIQEEEEAIGQGARQTGKVQGGTSRLGSKR